MKAKIIIIFFITIVAIVIQYGGNEKQCIAGVMDTITEYFIGKQYPVVSLKGMLLFTTNRFGELDKDGSAEIGIYVLDNGKIKKIRNGAIGGRWSSNGENIVCSQVKIKENNKSLDAITIINRKIRSETIILLKDSDNLYTNAVFSRDGNRVLFVSNINQDLNNKRESGPNNIFSVGIGKSNLKQITFFKEYVQSISNFDLSPDGKKLLFTSQGDWSNVGSKASVYLMDKGGNNITKLLGKTVIGYAPRWSQNGEQIVFCLRKKVGVYSQIFIMNKNGSNLRQVTNSDFDKDKPCWSPDGKMICYEGYRRKFYPELFVVNVDGSDESLVMKQTRVGKVWSSDMHPDWIE